MHLGMDAGEVVDARTKTAVDAGTPTAKMPESWVARLRMCVVAPVHRRRHARMHHQAAQRHLRRPLRPRFRTTVRCSRCPAGRRLCFPHRR